MHSQPMPVQTRRRRPVHPKQKKGSEITREPCCFRRVSFGLSDLALHRVDVRRITDREVEAVSAGSVIPHGLEIELVSTRAAERRVETENQVGIGVARTLLRLGCAACAARHAEDVDDRLSRREVRPRVVDDLQLEGNRAAAVVRLAGVVEQVELVPDRIADARRSVVTGIVRRVDDKDFAAVPQPRRRAAAARIM